MSPPFIKTVIFAVGALPSFATETISNAPLTAADVLKSDINPKIDELKDILFVLKLYPTFSEKHDYISIRQSLVYMIYASN